MLSYTALLSLAALAVAESFTLTAVGDNINSEVTYSGSLLTLKDGSVATFNLEQPAGYLDVNGQYVASTPDKGLTLTDKSDASSAWGYVDNKLRLNAAGSQNKFYACADGSAYKLSGIPGDGCTQVDLYLGNSAPASSSEAPASSSAAPASSSEAPATSSEAPASTTLAPASSEAPATTTDVSSTLVTVTSCSEGCSKSATVSSFEAGAGQAKMAAGALVAVGALLL